VKARRSRLALFLKFCYDKNTINTLRINKLITAPELRVIDDGFRPSAVAMVLIEDFCHSIS
jgi:hypothetical protein